jgi:hypothetical protein
MATTYAWAVTDLSRDTAGTVVKVHWKKTGTNEDGVSAEFNQFIDFDNGDPSSDSYISFDSLTEADVLSWVEGSVTGQFQIDVDSYIETQIQNHIDNAGIAEAHMPWVLEEEPPA